MSEVAAQQDFTYPIKISGGGLSCADLWCISDENYALELDEHISCEQLDVSRNIIHRALLEGDHIYGVNSLFGGMANSLVPEDQCHALQDTLINAHNVGVGKPLARENVRAAMAVRVNALANGHSAVRKELLNRYCTLLNADVMPVVRCLGSIGASGDLVPLAQIAGAVIGLSDCFTLQTAEGHEIPAAAWWQRRGIGSFQLQHKEGLALINGTSFHAAMISRTWTRLNKLAGINLAAHAVVAELLCADSGAFSEFVSRLKPHVGQQAIAEKLRQLLAGSAAVVDRAQRGKFSERLIQDRYSLRCMPQFLGPIYEGISHAKSHIEIELNSVTDNPLVDTDNDAIYHNGNFLGQQMAMTADQIRVWIALLAKHNEAQIALMVEPAFNGVLPPCLVDTSSSKPDVGLKPLQIVSNSIIPLLESKASPISVRFPVYAEQFNQNINSQAFNAATEAEESIGLYEKQLSIFLIFIHRAAKILGVGSFDGPKLGEAGKKFLEEVDFMAGDQGATPNTHMIERVANKLYSLSSLPFVEP